MFSGAARRLSRMLTGPGGKIFALAAPVVEVVLAAGIGLVVLLIVMAVFAPLPTPERLPAAQPGVVAASTPGEISNPFRSTSGPAAAAEEGPDLAETELDLTLHGTWVDDSGGAAIIMTPDGKQGRFSVGDEVWKGVRLDRVYRDQVVIVSDGARESLRLVNRDATSMAPPPLSPAAAVGGPAIPLSDAVHIVPRTGPDGVELRLEPGADRRRFAALGLKSGDILIAVDNRRIGPEIAPEAQRLRDLSGRSAVSVVVERDGVALPLVIDLATEGETRPNDG